MTVCINKFRLRIPIRLLKSHFVSKKLTNYISREDLLKLYSIIIDTKKEFKGLTILEIFDNKRKVIKISL